MLVHGGALGLGDREGGEGATATGGGGDCRGEEDGDELAGMPSSLRPTIYYLTVDGPVDQVMVTSSLTGPTS